MRGALRASMVALVLVNLAFVEITEAARWIWLGPLAAVTLLSPLLVPLVRHLWYRLTWNAVLVGVFLFLGHRFWNVGTQYLLEDGLLLAALCQVHLLNNIGDKQQPDLLFFNSFLMAVVTSFLSFDFAYCLVFLVYAPLLVLAMQLLALTRSGAAREPGLLRRALAQGLARSVVVLGLTMVVFFFLPRDFQRRGMLGHRFRFRPPGRLLDVDFTDEVKLDRSGTVNASDRVVMTVRLRRGSAAEVPVHWRGAVLDVFDGSEWKPAFTSFVQRDRPWRRSRFGGWQRGQGRRGTVVDVQMRAASPRLFVPIESREVLLDSVADYQPLADLSFRLPEAGNGPRDLGYRVEFFGERRALGGLSGTASNPIHTWVNLGAVPARALELARELRDQLPASAPQHEVVEHLRAYLATRYRYLPPGAEGGAQTLHAFFFDAAGGHCEYFATALTIMARSLGIPCRLATGYASTEWDSDERVLTIRARHAHAWVEVYDPQAGWYTVDPSPVASETATAADAGLVTMLRQWASGVWERVTGFNENQRGQVFAWLRAVPGRILAVARERPLPFVLAPLLLVGLAFLRRWRGRARVPRAARDYLDCLKHLGLERLAGETPRELCARAAADLTPAARHVLETATTTHELRRYR